MVVFKGHLKPIVVIVASLFVSTAFAQDEKVVQTENVSVFGQGQTRQIQSINTQDMERAVPGTSPLKVLGKLPGVNFQSSDPFGAYEWSTRFGVRGFAQTYMGFTLDGVPLGDMSYGNNNGLHISRAIASENISRADLSQGAGSLGVASTSNLGGTVQFYSAEPDNKFGVRLDQSVGSNNLTRTFVKVDTGLLGSGTKAYVSYNYQDVDKWKGDGQQKLEQFNSKIVNSWGESRVSAFYNHSDRNEQDYGDMSHDIQRKLGWNWDNYAPDFRRAVDAANGVFTGGVQNINPNTGPLDAAYYLGRGLRKDDLVGTSMDLALSDDVRLKANIYHHRNEGQGHWFTPYVRSPGVAAAPGVYSGPGLPISLRTTEYKLNRTGALSDITWVNGVNTFNAGVWVEKSDHNLQRNYYAVTDGSYQSRFLSNGFRTDFNQDFTTTTTQFHVQDTLTLLGDKLKVNVGFKSPEVEIEAKNISGNRSQGQITAKDNFLPQFGANYALNDNNEMFVSASENMRAYQPGVNGPFSQTPTAFAVGQPNLKPETSETFEVGYRYKDTRFQGSLVAYMTDFSDRLLQVNTTAGIISVPGVFVNVGKVQSKGVEAAFSWSPVDHWTWFNSFTFNDSQYKSNYTSGGNVVNISGKQVVDAPRIMFNTEVGYAHNGWFGNINAKYTDKRYYTYLNDAKVDSYWDTNASFGYMKKNVMGFSSLSAQVSVVNLLDVDYFATIGSNGFIPSDPQGAFATLQRGAPRQVFLTVSGRF
jgi:iron complex outermembrane receptor protein